MRLGTVIPGIGMAVTAALILGMLFNYCFPNPQPQDLIHPGMAPNPAPWDWPIGFCDPDTHICIRAVDENGNFITETVKEKESRERRESLNSIIGWS